MAFTKATRSRSLLRLAMFGPSGSGKTYSSLAVASGMAEAIGSRVAVVDTERGSASKYADRFDFDVLELDDPRPDAYVDAMRDAARSGYKVVVLDSLTHGWQELLDEVDKIASRMGGNTWAAWSKATPQQRRLIDAILRYPGHVIATMRAKTAWETGTDKRGKAAPVKVGLAPEQRAGLEYEFDFLGSIDPDHVLKVEKDRTGRYQDRYIELPGVDFGRELVAWLNEGDEPPRIPASRSDRLTTEADAVIDRFVNEADRVIQEAARKASRPEVPAKTQAGPKPAEAPAEDFDTFFSRKVESFRRWCQKEKVAFPEGEVQSNRMLNGLMSKAVEKGGVRIEEISRPNAKGEPVRRNDLMRRVFEDLARDPAWSKWLEKAATAYLKGKVEAEAIRSTEGGNDDA